VGDALERLRLRVTGRVQGVWYRGAMQSEANRLGVHGWVRNLADGSVEAVIEGAPSAVRALRAWCESGPPGAHVVQVVASPEPTGGELHGFHIRH
jgi:acylphosphatase